MTLTLAGLAGTLALAWQPVNAFHIAFDVGTQLVAAMAVVTGVQLVSFACFTKVFGIGEGLLPEDRRFARVFRVLTLERGLALGGVILSAGVRPLSPRPLALGSHALRYVILFR